MNYARSICMRHSSCRVTPQSMRELWGCIEDLSVTSFNLKKVSAWLKDLPGALNQDWQMPEIK